TQSDCEEGFSPIASPVIARLTKSAEAIPKVARSDSDEAILKTGSQQAPQSFKERDCFAHLKVRSQ
ncbi:MAG: hypothetical protein Q8O01_05210, partial [Candidatus Omnitrophota bacterium]|nr:hypothetical protein [Candidatus Omnitrophota bacterium]